MDTPISDQILRLTESAKAFINAIEGDNVIFTSELKTIEEYESTIQTLNQEVKLHLEELKKASSQYQNLRKEFQKVCEERDRLVASQVDNTRAKAEIKQLQSRLQAKDQEIHNLSEEISKRDPRDPFKIVEDLYQAYRTVFSRYGFDTSRKETQIDIRVSCKGAVVAQTFVRHSATNYNRSNIATNLSSQR